ncbi:uncharacterized protein BT62DRAFT_195324 [Guyanagaster necrorhizus]|uniref:Uncharacterized protein n=1 Tax=Guyanagaster necrorhizus TaxID=856835 RepID=A0A9P7VRQ3_9AGAR|nr:uncharacterized protein BT62DRAFT_195324 [Guyanagaster necrorhizus MCA 3950]KAG7445448.1 hypothetical protein BT62DRAFT_195324 [Guyanagaster necrorhizus MCA 3950]
MIPSRWERTRRMSTVYINGQGGHIVMGKLFLDKEEWLRKPSLLERSTRCSGCLGIINFEEDYDVDVWTRHRDSCRGIEERMMITIARALEFPARDMDEYDMLHRQWLWTGREGAWLGDDNAWENQRRWETSIIPMVSPSQGKLNITLREKSQLRC